ncbi:MAG: cation diffusion facilitator family transporter [Chloroflexota bacterium]
MNAAESAQETQPQRPPYLRVGIYSLLVNVGLVAAKLTLSFITGSIALRADAIHSSVDIFGSLALIVGLVIANRKTRKFPYGLYKVENVVSVIISVLLFVTAYEIGRQAIVGESSAVPYGGWVLGVVGGLILVPFLFSRYEVRIGEKYNSPSLIADGKQFRADVLTASIVFFALLAQYFGFPLDRIAAGIVALFIVRAGWELMWNSMRVLLDASVESGTLDDIRAVIEAEPAVTSIQHLTGRNSGRYVFVEATVSLRVSNLKTAHLVSERLERNVKEAQCCVDRVLIHYEPEEKTEVRYAVPLASRQGEISPHFGEAPHFALIDFDKEQKRITGREILDNPHADLEKGKGLTVAQFLLEYKPDVIASRERLSGKGPGYAFADAGVETVQTKARSIDEFISQLEAQPAEGADGEEDR